MELKSPCKKCDLHAQGINKSSEECVKCEKRIEYVRGEIKSIGFPTKDGGYYMPEEKQCENCKKSLPLDQFPNHAFTADKKLSICRQCHVERCRKGGKVKKPIKRKYTGKTKIPDVQVLSIDFSGYEKEYQKLTDLAHNEVRTTENQVLFIVLQHLKEEEASNVDR